MRMEMGRVIPRGTKFKYNSKEETGVFHQEYIHGKSLLPWIKIDGKKYEGDVLDFIGDFSDIAILKEEEH